MFKIIEAGSTGVVQTLGRYTKSVGPGFYMYMPLIQKITKIRNKVYERKVDVSTKTSDNVFTELAVATQYRVTPKGCSDYMFKLGSLSTMDSFIENAVRAKVPGMILDKVYTQQDDISDYVNKVLKDDMDKYGIEIINTLITNVQPDHKVAEAMNEINAADRLKTAAQYEADAEYIRSTRIAEADKERKRLQGEGISLQRKAILSSYQDGIQEMSIELGVSPNRVLDFVQNVQYMDTLSEVGRSENTKVLFMSSDVDGGLTNKLIASKET